MADDYITVQVTDAMRERAARRLEEANVRRAAEPHQFGAEEERTLWGYIGEEVANSVLHGTFTDTYDHDIMRWGRRYEIKTIRCKARPPPHFLAVVNSCDIRKQHKQSTDSYVFVRLREDHELGWVVGYLGAVEFMRRGRFLRKGETLFPGQKLEKASCTVLPIHDLLPARDLRPKTRGLFAAG